jgi:protein-S-isoprenylcysteine O-methyltransferase Ste14
MEGRFMERTLRWRWRNIPLPEVHLALLVVGLILNVVWRRRIASARSVRRFGWPLIIIGVAWAAWATQTAGQVNLERPERLVTGGPYAISRHPMYVAWTLIYVGIALALNVLWLLILLPLLAVLIHREAQREEDRLDAAFGDDYRTYRRRVRPYL